MALEAHEEDVDSWLDEFGGLLMRDAEEPGVYWLVVMPSSAPSDVYYVRVAWATYPDRPPSVRFHDGVAGPYATNTAWPKVDGYRPGSWDICEPFTAEGFALHPEWATGPHAWVSTGNPFLWVAQVLQTDLNTRYQGRHQ